MRNVKLAALGLCFAANLAFAGSPAGPSSPNYYKEVDDAGNRSSPQNVQATNPGPGGPTGFAPWSGFSGDLGGCLVDNGEPSDSSLFVCLSLDKKDAFRFFFDAAAGGSPFVMEFDFSEFSSPSDVTVELYKEGSIADGDKLSHEGTNWGTLLAGNYIIEFSTTYLVDPPFSGTLFSIDPRSGDTIFPQLITVPQATPAPGALALLLAGLAGLGYSRRRATAA